LKRLADIVLIAACLACAGVAFLALGRIDALQAVAPGPDPALYSVRQRIMSLESRLEGLAGKSEAQVAAASMPIERSAVEDWKAMLLRVEVIENALGVPVPIGSRDSAQQVDSWRMDAARAATEEYRQRLLDPKLEDRNRAEAFSWLRRLPNDERSQEAVDAALDIAATSGDATARTLVMQSCRGASLEEGGRLARVIDIAQRDSNPRVREEAAEVLGDFRGRADVRSVLEAMKAGDTDVRVRHQAEISLAGLNR